MKSKPLINKQLETIAIFFNNVSLFFSKISRRKLLNFNNKEIKDSIDIIASNTENFFRTPLEKSKIVTLSDYKQATFLFFCLKQVISWYEVENNILPIQLYNEIRNAFDHFIRGLVTNEKEHIIKLEGHLQRGILDACKMICNFYKKKIIQVHKRIPKKAFHIISNGDYLKEFYTKETTSDYLYETARYNECLIGNDNNTNKDILEMYMKALISYRDLYEYQNKNKGNIFKAKFLHLTIINGKSFFLGIISAILVKYSVEFISKILAPLIKQLFTSITS